MSFESFVSMTGIVLAAGLAVFVLLRRPSSFVHRMLALALAALAVEETCAFGLAVSAFGEEVQVWLDRQSLVQAVLPGAWIAFATCFARSDYRAILRRRAPLLAAAFLLPGALAAATWLAGRHFYGHAENLSDFSRWLVPLEHAGTALYLLLLAGSVQILMDLERTFRAAAGSKRWRIKFLVVGAGLVFAVRVYTRSQALLLGALDTAFTVLHSTTLVAATVLMAYSLIRNDDLEADVDVARLAPHSSVVFLFTSIYFVVSGALPLLIRELGGRYTVALGGLSLAAAACVLLLVLFSGRLRQQFRRVVNRTFGRPHYDYRREWLEFTRRTSAVVDARALCGVVATRVSEIFAVASVTVWLQDEASHEPILGGSTAFSEAQARELLARFPGAGRLPAAMREVRDPVDFRHPPADDELGRVDPAFLEEARVRHAVTLIAGGERLGVLTLEERTAGTPFSIEDLDLLKTLADQSASSLLHLRLSERLLRAKEMEAFQTLAAFFVHDLKNLASRLSVTMQNLPEHFDDPEFRRDMLGVITRSVAKIDSMCSRLTPLSRPLELGRVEGDLNAVVSAGLAGLHGSLRATLAQSLSAVPRVALDPEQMQRVLTNLVLNAEEAAGADGRIEVATAARPGWIVLSVRDNGCGMSRSFVAESLFQPFKTTKKRGLGIGLFHCKKIVEAHGGRIEVESEQGRGSTFRVLLPERARETVGTT